MVRCPARAAPPPVPHRARVSVYDAVYTCRVHRRTPAQAGEHADTTSATTTTQNAGALPTTARRLALYAYTHSPRQPRGAEAVEPSPWRPGESTAPAIPHCLCEDLGKRALCRSQAGAPQPERGARFCLASCSLPGCLAASRPPRPAAGGGYRVHLQRPSLPGLARFRRATACGPNDSGPGRHLWPPVGLVATPSPSRGASGARFPPTPRCRVWLGAWPRVWHNSPECGTSPRDAGRL